MPSKDTSDPRRARRHGGALQHLQLAARRPGADAFDGERHLYQCLIVTSREEAGERIYEFKRNTAASDTAPLDFERASDAPVVTVAVLNIVQQDGEACVFAIISAISSAAP